MKYLITLMLIFISVFTVTAQNKMLRNANKAVFNSLTPNSNSKVNMLYDYNFGYKHTKSNSRHHNANNSNNLTIFVIERDYSMILNTNPSIGVRNYPNNKLYRINTTNNLNHAYKIIE